MKRSIPIIVLACAILCVAALPSPAASPHATLIDVHHLLQAKGGQGGGKPQPGANCTNDDSSQYTGQTAATGWTVPAPLTAHLNTATVPSGIANATAAMQAAFNAWSGGAVPSITVASDGTATRYKADRTDALLFGKTGGSIATTYTWRWSDGFVESDTVFNNTLGWFQASSEGDGCVETAGNNYDVRNIATHEFGHTYGLDHVNGRFETMYPYGYTGETLKWTPTSGEKSGLAALY